MTVQLPNEIYSSLSLVILTRSFYNHTWAHNGRFRSAAWRPEATTGRSAAASFEGAFGSELECIEFRKHLMRLY